MYCAVRGAKFIAQDINGEHIIDETTENNFVNHGNSVFFPWKSSFFSRNFTKLPYFVVANELYQTNGGQCSQEQKVKGWRRVLTNLVTFY